MGFISRFLGLAVIAVIVYLFLNAPASSQVISSTAKGASDFFRTLQGR